jgi:hypothetical protein
MSLVQRDPCTPCAFGEKPLAGLVTSPAADLPGTNSQELSVAGEPSGVTTEPCEHLQRMMRRSLTPGDHLACGRCQLHLQVHADHAVLYRQGNQVVTLATLDLDDCYRRIRARPPRAGMSGRKIS